MNACRSCIYRTSHCVLDAREVKNKIGNGQWTTVTFFPLSSVRKWNGNTHQLISSLFNNSKQKMKINCCKNINETKQKKKRPRQTNVRKQWQQNGEINRNADWVRPTRNRIIKYKIYANDPARKCIDGKQNENAIEIIIK